MPLDGVRMRIRAAPPGEETVAQLRGLARPLADPSTLDALVERLAPARCVLLGEASHGTSEYYTWRAALSERLVRDHGFRFVAVEGDWPACYLLNRYAKGLPGSGPTARDAQRGIDRWPTWMWANEEVEHFLGRLRALNDHRPPEERAGFYGLDVYSLFDSLRAILAYLERADHGAVEAAKRAFRCFEPYAQDPESYALSTTLVPSHCADEVADLLAELRRADIRHPNDPEAALDAEQNAHVAVGAERYYRTMVRGGAASWNVRDTHMADTLQRLLSWHGEDAKGIVWAHNTHVGDARATDMVQAGEVNLGQLARERLGPERVAILGFGSHGGSVVAARAWGGPMERMPVPPAQPGSWEDAFRRTGLGDVAMVLREPGEELRLGHGLEPDGEGLWARRGHRAIGVVYHPESERGNYVPTVLPLRYDAFVFLKTSRALEPLPARVAWRKVPETFPTGV